MIEEIIKRDGRHRPFDFGKIEVALRRSMDGVVGTPDFREIFQVLQQKLNNYPKTAIGVEDVQDIIEETLINLKQVQLYASYVSYRKERTRIRDLKSGLMCTVHNIGVETDRDNANVGNNFSSKLLRIASETNKWHNLAKMPKHLAKLHEQGDLYYHDLDSYNLTVNCLHLSMSYMFGKGFNTGYGTIRKPKRIESAAEQSCILLQSSQNDMFGGQSHVNFDNDLAPYVELTRKEHTIRVLIEKALSDDSISDEVISFCYGLLDYTSQTLRDFSILDDFNVKVLEDYAKQIGADLTEVLSTQHEVFKLFEDARSYVNNNANYFNQLPKRQQLAVLNNVNTSVHQAMQGVVYNLNTMHSRAGSQVPFSSVNIGLPLSEDAALICKVFLEEYEKGLGKNEQPIFPNIIFRVKQGVNRDKSDPYYYLFKIACRVAAKRMNPTFMNIDADFNLKYYNKGIFPATMGCRTYICSNVNGPEGPDRRGNNAPTTINLPRIGIESHGDLDIFWKLLDYKLEMSKNSLLHRYDVLKNLKVKDLPFVVGEGLILGSENLQPNDSIEPVLRQGSWAIGFIGLAETLIALTGKHHGESEEARELGYRIVQHIRDFTDRTIEETHLNWSCYATPAEGLSGKFVKQDREKYGVLPGITDKDYYTNSFHVPVYYKISIPDKIQIEAPFHKMCNAGHISYIEIDGYPEADTIERIITYAYTQSNISYIGINFHMRYCKDCGQKLTSSEQTCPKCNSSRIQGISRVTGYLSLDERFGAGKSAERKDRLSHDTNHRQTYQGI